MPDQPFLDGFFGGQADIRPCRKKLHGLAFKDIMRRAYPHEEPAGGANPGAT